MQLFDSNYFNMAIFCTWLLEGYAYGSRGRILIKDSSCPAASSSWTKNLNYSQFWWYLSRYQNNLAKNLASKTANLKFEPQRHSVLCSISSTLCIFWNNCPQDYLSTVSKFKWTWLLLDMCLVIYFSFTQIGLRISKFNQYEKKERLNLHCSI